MAELAADDPQWIGGYRLLRRLGSGGMGRVYLARSEGGRTVAVKHVKAELAAEPEFRERFRLEVEAARSVGERWTAPVLDADTEAPTPWVATGYIAGPSLDQVVAGSGDGHTPLPEESVRTLAYGLAGALTDIHGAGIIHRDLKPSNVLVTIDGPRVIDFGIARALDAVTESTMTNTGVVVGSPSYMSPEQIRSERLTAASDVFCMGSVLAYAATGCPPFGSGGGSGGMHAVMFRIAEEEPDLAGVGDPLQSLIRGCLVKDPARRLTPEAVADAARPTPSGTASPPWLPATLIAELGRHAVRLLDTDTPPSGSGARTGATPADAATGAATGSGGSSGSGAQDHGGQGGGLDSGQDGSGGTPVQVSPAAEARTAMLPRTDDTGSDGHTGADDTTGARGARGVPDAADAADAAKAADARTGRKARKGLLAGAVLVAVLAVGAGFVATGAEIPGLGGSSGDGGDDKPQPPKSDVPGSYVGTWSGPVERDGQRTGQHRRFVITEGRVGEVVANSVSLGTTYECKSDATLVSAGPSLKLDTKVVSSVPDEACSALGSHALTRAADGTLEWEAAGREATLRKVRGEETLPAAFHGTWQRPLANGGTQRLTIRSTAEAGSSRGISMVSESPAEHCEASVDLFSAGNGQGPVRIAPPAVDEAASSGACSTGNASTLRMRDGQLQRVFPGNGQDGGQSGSQTLVYTRAN